jgi:cobalt-zinc-cadmium efflux system membrane fusion protein
MTATSPGSLRSTQSRYRLWAGGVAAILVLTGLWWLGLPPFSAANVRESRTQRAPVGPTVVQVELSDKQVGSLKIAPVGQAGFEVLRGAVGNIDFNQNMLVQVFTPNPGRILQAFGNIGDRVERGQILFTVDSPDLLTAESNLIQAAGVLTLQNRNLKRVTENLHVGGGAQKDVDQAVSDQQTAEGNLKAARDAVRIFGKTDAEIDQIIYERRADPALIVRSPINGAITQRTAAPGLYVQPGNNPAPLTVADTSTMWMLANVVENDAPLLRVGQEVKVRVGAWPDRTFDGAITVLGAQIDPATRRIWVRSEIRDPEGLLRPGMFANFTIRMAPPFQAAAVPAAAIVREGDGSMSVWVTADRRHFEKRTVRIGLQQNGMVQILDGLRPGELVVGEGAVFVSNKALGGTGAGD